MFGNIAYAMGPGGGAEGASGGPGGMLIPLVMMFVIFYFLLIRPQQKKAKQLQNMIKSLKKGDRVITTGGIFGQIASLDDTTITLEIADKVKIKVNRGNVAGIAPGAQPPAAEAKGK